MRPPAVLRRSGFDSVLAIALAVPCLGQVLVAPIAPRPVGVLIALLSTLPVAWRRRHPALAALAGSAVWLVPADGFLALGYVLAFVLFYSLTRYEEDARRALAVTLFGVAAGLVGSALQHAAGVEYLGAAGAVVTPAVAGWIVRRSLAREREQAAAAAVAEERARIARELHDVVAHGLSVVAIQADAAEGALDRDPDLARVPLRRIHASATEALSEMRRLLRVLRVEGEAAARVPQPGLAQLPALLVEMGAAGQVVSLEERGAPRRLAPGLELSVYRIVQEALTNARRHAAGSATTVVLDWEPDTIGVRVRTAGGGAVNGSGHGSGHGLIGMRERARLHHGDLKAGPAPDGGWTVAARLPLRGEG